MIMWQPGVSLADIEKQIILKAYRFYNQNKAQTAHSLGIDVKTLYTKLKKYGMETVK